MERISPAEHPSFSTTDYAQLRAEALEQVDYREAKRPTLAQYEEGVGSVLRTKEYYRRRSIDPSESIALLKEIYVEGEENSHLAHFNELLIDTPQVMRMSGKLNFIRQSLQGGDLSAADRHRAIKQEQEVVYRMCEYNHHLRDVIEAGRVQFTGPQLASWLEQAGNVRNGWAGQRIKGSVSEIALHEAGQSLPGLEWIRYGDVWEDLKGADIVMQLHGRRVELDAKSGGGVNRAEKRGSTGRTLHLQIAVPEGATNDLRLTHDGRRNLVRSIEEGYSQVA